jgi:hypothetical protein
MGTRSTISVEAANGMISTVYCHWDGYLKNNGRILNRSYTTLEQATALVSGGDMSSLEDDIDKVSYYAEEDERKSVQVCRNFKQFECSLGMGEYDYLMRADGVWYVKTHRVDEFVPLADELYNLAAATPE